MSRDRQIALALRQCLASIERLLVAMDAANAAPFEPAKARIEKPEKESSMSTDQAIEQEIQAKGLTAPRVTPADIEAAIASAHYFTAADGVFGATTFDVGDDSPLNLLTFCVLVLRNGFTVTGESACASPENFDAELGRKIARRNAEAKIWPLLGYELRTLLATEP
jgi:hypothetical protein